MHFWYRLCWRPRLSLSYNTGHTDKLRVLSWKLDSERTQSRLHIVSVEFTDNVMEGTLVMEAGSW
jgi:hypothetical protein